MKKYGDDVEIIPARMPFARTLTTPGFARSEVKSRILPTSTQVYTDPTNGPVRKAMTV